MPAFSLIIPHSIVFRHPIPFFDRAHSIFTNRMKTISTISITEATIQMRQLTNDGSIPRSPDVLVISGIIDTKVKVRSLRSPFMNHEVNVISSFGGAILFSNLGFNIKPLVLPSLLSTIFPQFPTTNHQPPSKPPSPHLWTCSRYIQLSTLHM